MVPSTPAHDTPSDTYMVSSEAAATIDPDSLLPTPTPRPPEGTKATIEVVFVGLDANGAEQGIVGLLTNITRKGRPSAWVVEMVALTRIALPLLTVQQPLVVQRLTVCVGQERVVVFATASGGKPVSSVACARIGKTTELTLTLDT